MNTARILQFGVAALMATSSLVAQNSVSLTIDSKMDIYRAGGYDDGSDGIAPVVFSFPSGPSRVVSFSTVGGAWTCRPQVPVFGADGTPPGGCMPGAIDPVGTFAGYQTVDFSGALVGMFLADDLPTSTPPTLRFYSNNASHGGIQTNFSNLRPAIGQVFFVGDGLTGTGIGNLQNIHVPPTAKHLYLGFADSCQSIPGCFSDNSGSLSASVVLRTYVPEWTQPTLSSAPSARALAGIAHDVSTDSTVLFGGSNARLPNGVVFNETWIWHQGWKQAAPPLSPPARCCAGMAYDQATGTVVLFGGQDAHGVVSGDTWIWDGVNWAQQFPPVSPPARSAFQSMIYNPISGTVVLFGGGGNENNDYGDTPFGDTWEWNGRTKTWTQKFPASSPSPRGSSLSYDPITKKVILFGGDDGGGDCCRTYFNETWVWDGVNWTQQFPPNSPSPRTGPAMAYASSLGEVIVFGGTSAPPQGMNDTWGWNGKNWTKLRATQPSGLWDAPMDFDSSIGGMVLFGGELSGDIVTNSTWLLVPVAAP